MWYSKQVTETHPLALKYPKSVTDISEVIVAEGGRNINCIERVINLDIVETERCSGSSADELKTMDIAVGVCHGALNEIVLCELRLRYKSAKQLKYSEIDGKLRHSKELCGQLTCIHRNFFFVFQDRIVQQAKAKLRRLNKNKSTWLAISSKELKTIIFS